MASRKVAYLILNRDEFVLGNRTGNVMAFECIMSLALSRTSTVTEHHVEEGAAIVDHVRGEPEELTLELAVSNFPTDWDDPDGIARAYGATQFLFDLEEVADGISYPDGRTHRNPALAGKQATLWGYDVANTTEGTPNVGNRNVVADTRRARGSAHPRRADRRRDGRRLLPEHGDHEGGCEA